MTDHIKECESFRLAYDGEWPVCICEELRSAMRRVISTGAGAAADIEFGRQEGLREARAAIDALTSHESEPSFLSWRPR